MKRFLMWLLILGTTMAGVIGCSKEADTKHENDKPKETTTKQKEEQQKVEQEEISRRDLEGRTASSLSSIFNAIGMTFSKIRVASS